MILCDSISYEIISYPKYLRITGTFGIILLFVGLSEQEEPVAFLAAASAVIAWGIMSSVSKSSSNITPRPEWGCGGAHSHLPQGAALGNT